MQISSTCSRQKETRNAYKIMVEKYERREPLGKPTCKLEYNIKMRQDCIHLAEDRSSGFVNMVITRRVPYKTANYLPTLKTTTLFRISILQGNSYTISQFSEIFHKHIYNFINFQSCYRQCNYKLMQRVIYLNRSRFTKPNLPLA